MQSNSLFYGIYLCSILQIVFYVEIYEGLEMYDV